MEPGRQGMGVAITTSQGPRCGPLGEQVGGARRNPSRFIEHLNKVSLKPAAAHFDDYVRLRTDRASLNQQTPHLNRSSCLQRTIKKSECFR